MAHKQLLTLIVVIIILVNLGKDSLTNRSEESPAFSLSSVSAYSVEDTLLSPTADVNWSMAGANPQRTSWVPVGVNPEAYGDFGIEWYMPIEAYIGQHVQLITARDKVYVSSARGVYALDAASGNLIWRFDTEMPIGHSPTVVGNVLYVGGLDRRVYALNADTGSLIWTFTGAKGGFSTNPLVVEGKVLLGNRDGYFYSLDQSTGQLLWQYPATHQDPLGPILYSAAYKDGQVFFASNNNYAYSLNVDDGSLIWRSAKMPGDGYQAWWPVVYNNHVIFSSAPAYAEMADPGTSSVADVVDPSDPYYSQMQNFQYSLDFIKTLQRDDVFHQGEGGGSMLGPDFTAGGPGDSTGIVWSWGNGKTIIDASKATEYLENDGQAMVNRHIRKPWRRGFIVLSVADGSEYTYDSDNDGHFEYAPYLFTGTKSGNRYPPLVIPMKDAEGVTNNVVHAQNLNNFYGGWGIPRARLTAWEFGTQYIHPIGVTWAIDEPFADSSGGTMLYQNLCCDRIGMATNMTTGSTSQFWGYSGWALETIKYPWNQIEPWMDSLAPGYDFMWSGASMYDYYPRLNGSYGTQNGIYHNSGLQNPIIPYKGRLYVHRSNAIIALGPKPVSIRKVTYNETPQQYEQNIRQEYPRFSRPLLRINPADQDLDSLLTSADVQASLDDQISKMLQSGHLRPGYYNSTRMFPQFANYYENPGDTLYTLVIAYDYVSDWLKPDLEKYIKQHYKKYFENGLYARTGYWINAPKPYNLSDPEGLGQLQSREWMPLPPEVDADIINHQADLFPGINWSWNYPQHNFYAMWLYAESFHSNDPAKLKLIYEAAKSRLETTPPEQDSLLLSPWVHNGFIAGYIGLLNLQKLSGSDHQDAALRLTVQARLDQLLTLRSADFRKDHPWGTDKDGTNPDVVYRSFNVARNFLYLTPELAEHLRVTTLDKVTEAIDEYNWIAPYWIASRYEASFGEFASDNLYTNHSMFQSKTRILKEPEEQLLKYLDAPAFRVGDLFYIQNLVAILENSSYGIRLTATPLMQSVKTAGTANFKISVKPTGGFTKTVKLEVNNSDSSLDVNLSSSSVNPPADVTLTVTDLHKPGSLTSGIWYTLQLTAEGDGIRETVELKVLVNGHEFQFPIISKNRG